jgi:DNA-binding IclR family transcriptional regulator
VAAIGMSSTILHIDKKNIKELIKLIKSAATKISRQLGFKFNEDLGQVEIFSKE